MTTDLRNSHRDCLEDFIEIYKNEKCLWQVKCKEYYDRAKKDAAYVKLVEKLKEIDPLADKRSVVKKINNIRSNYRKELKKVNLSIKTGVGANEVYVPKLWYFDLLKFTTDEEMTRISRSSLDSGDDDDCEYEEPPGNDVQFLQSTGELMSSSVISQENELSESTVSSGLTPGLSSLKRSQSHFRPTKLKANEEATHEVLNSVNQRFERPQVVEDRFDVFGKNVAMKLRDLPSQQRIICEKLINDSLFAAEMGKLTPKHKFW